VSKGGVEGAIRENAEALRVGSTGNMTGAMSCQDDLADIRMLIDTDLIRGPTSASRSSFVDE
jgi:hypothetical protein